MFVETELLRKNDHFRSENVQNVLIKRIVYQLMQQKKLSK